MIEQATYERFVEDLCAGDRVACRATVAALLAAAVPVRTIYGGLFREALYEVGRRWEAGEVSVAVEHVATAITEDLIAMVYPTVATADPLGRRAVVSCAADEYHQLGGRIVADVLELRGWDVAFVGASVAQDALVAVVTSQRPHLVGISVSIPDHVGNAQAAVVAVRGVGLDMPIVIGGHAAPLIPAGWLAAQRGVTVLASLEEFELALPAWERA